MTTEQTTLLETEVSSFPGPAEVMTVLIEVPPGSSGTPPHRHSGPVFGYVIEGELLYQLEGSPARVVGPGEAFWEPGGDRIHLKAANNLSDRWTRFVAVMVGVPGEPMLTLVDPDELGLR